MVIADREFAHRWLANVSYYRLSSYWHPNRQRADDGRLLDTFIPGTNFADVASLYEFDRHLKNLMLSAVERLEVSMRAHVAYAIGRHGPLAYLDSAPFNGHHFDNYRGRISIWVLTEVLDFADVSKVYKGLRVDDRDEIARTLGIVGTRGRAGARPGDILANLLEHLAVVRNISAHHSRLWNRTIMPVGVARLREMDSFHGVAGPQCGSIYVSICAAAHILQHVSPGTTWTDRVATMITDRFDPIPLRSSSEMGFPSNWRDLPLWS
ncbi:Abi family protein [Gordonia malaquae]|uniref:Abi family protein n=1 Tax=Gordonia malaquae NBRC 108250 TaxID=1223542 RepID=M3UI18_GORML|nr:Abi family protein [Gordonia malaquae]GAC79050.1 hypothetical protein GM1_007_00090 [Gordonia malaquae NBRC 108250]